MIGVFFGMLLFQVVTKARVVAMIGYHEIYKIEEVILIPLAVQGIPVNNPDELRYLKLFQVNLVIHFYCHFVKRLGYSDLHIYSL